MLSERFAVVIPAYQEAATIGAIVAGCRAAAEVLEVIVDAYGRQNRVQIARNTGLSDSEIETATADLLQIKVV